MLLLKSALSPMAVLKFHVVLVPSAFIPRLVLPCAQTTPARDSEKMSAAKRTEKNDAVLEWLNMCKPSLTTIYLKTA